MGLGEERPKDEKREEASDNMPCTRQRNKSNVAEIETMVKLVFFNPFPPLFFTKQRGKRIWIAKTSHRHMGLNLTWEAWG